MRAGAWMCTLILLTSCGEEVTVQVEGAGRVTSSPPGIDCGMACRTKVSSGSQLQLTVQPAAGSIFAGWGGACSGQKETCTITVDAPASVTVKLSKLHRVEIQRAGDGKGLVTSQPPGIECGEKCSAEFPDGTAVTLDVKPELGVKLLQVGPCGSKSPCELNVRSPLVVRVELDVVPGALLSSQRIDDEGGGAFALDPRGNAVWSREQRLETYAPDGKRIGRSSLADARITVPRAVASASEDSVIVAGDSAEGSRVASIRPTGDLAWSIEVPGRILGAGAWSQGSVVALAIEDKVTIGERSYGAKKKPNALLLWLDTAGKVSDAKLLDLPVARDATAAFTVDGRGAAVFAAKAGKKHVLAKASGAEGQSWRVELGELERAFVHTTESGDVWVAGSATSLEEPIREAGASPEKKGPCRDGRFGFIARFDAAGEPQSARALMRGIRGFALDPAGVPLAAMEIAGEVATSTGTFTSAKAPDAMCGPAADVLIGALTPAFDLRWGRQLTAEGELSVDGFGTGADGLLFTAVMSSGRIRVIGGAHEATIPSGVSLLVFR